MTGARHSRYRTRVLHLKTHGEYHRVADPPRVFYLVILTVNPPHS
jgi:hypothetical protein